MNYPCIFLMGPTAAGKTALAVELVKALPCDIISVDSAMVYRGLDIGTAKPNHEVLTQAPHRLIDIRDPAQAYSAACFREDALKAIEDIQKQGKIPLLVGGTRLYFNSLQYGLSDLPSAAPEIRARLSQQAHEYGWPALHQRLAAVDPLAAERIHPHDPQRIQRALEVYECSGQPMSHWYRQAPVVRWSQPVVKCILAPAQRSVLHAKIAQRFEGMLQQGFIEEVKQLYQRPDLNLSLPALRAVGYRQVWRYLAGELDYAKLVETGIIATRQFAKRQLTWLRSETEAKWFDSQQLNVNQQVLKWLHKIPMLSRYC